MKREEQVARCEAWIKKLFADCIAVSGHGIEINFFWRLAQEAGLWEPGEYGGPMTDALRQICDVKHVFADGAHIYMMFVLKEN